MNNVPPRPSGRPGPQLEVRIGGGYCLRHEMNFVLRGNTWLCPRCMEEVEAGKGRAIGIPPLGLSPSRS